MQIHSLTTHKLSLTIQLHLLIIKLLNKNIHTHYSDTLTIQVHVYSHSLTEVHRTLTHNTDMRLIVQINLLIIQTH